MQSRSRSALRLQGPLPQWHIPPHARLCAAQHKPQAAEAWCIAFELYSGYAWARPTAALKY
eukprot:scaffold30486_cov63-Phaeocystis_antarctica.AAC.6